MSKTIRIGTRDSELALWQANTVKKQLEEQGYQTVLVPVKSMGDLVLDKPLHELGITGVFTKALDVAMLKGQIDIAVHSMKDVPTVLPKGIIQAAVLKRGNYMDILAFKNNEEFLSQEKATIATGSLRRKAQWLNRYPTHTVVDLRGNVQTRAEKLDHNDWNGAIFAAAGLERVGLEFENTIGLTWMVPAPAQGAVVIVALDNDDFSRKACAELNDKETQICTGLERQFLNILEGGCTAPIGALSTIKDKNISLKGVLLSVDGKKKLEVEFTSVLGKHENLAIAAAERIFERGGRNLMREIAGLTKEPTIFSTKKLTVAQLAQFNPEISVASEDFLRINLNRIPKLTLKKELQNVIITSQNAVEAILASISPEELQFKNIYCVGRKTKRLIEKHIGKVTHFESQGKDLANYLVEYLEGTDVTYFCSDIRLDTIPTVLEQNNISVHEIEAYSTKEAPVKIPKSTRAVLFYSPSAVQSYLQVNTSDLIAYCIGETTAEEARKSFSEVRVAQTATIEGVIDLVNKK
ncbi:hydroxymethylbilane synthase [Cellulophaga sp. Hel_I_12]|uniref:hydroxymethylbilane synthase n=1 Tax=Cellulophaga sp. Hel_I_12 TaxID=1249972 RepID=UPI00064601B6|nr:hydroxymethylbilane synthase [Cellulophaga sp. Hel_I_12]